jgi:hypothetical protein
MAPRGLSKSARALDGGGRSRVIGVRILVEKVNETFRSCCRLNAATD